MEEYRGNSNKLKEKMEETTPKIEPVVTTARKKTDTKMAKFKKAMIADDSKNIGAYIFFDIIIPNLKKGISETVSKGIDMILYGGSASSSSATRTNASRVSYRSAYSTPSATKETYSRNPFDYDQIIFETRGDAETVLYAMDDILSTYPTVSVGDLYDLADISTDNYMVNKYGWTDISRAEVVRIKEGYVIKLPKAMPITK